jgi:arylsulfatase A-like enzyme/Flp pilus assembly protein TadD
MEKNDAAASQIWRSTLRLEERSRLLRSASLYALATILLFIARCDLLAEAANPTPVILISVDTLRADHLGCYGYGALPTPHIDAMREGATQFLTVNAQVPLTLPSHVSLLTSTYPFSNGVEDNGAVLVQGEVTLSSLLKSRGYRTAAFIGGFPLDRRFGLDQGFDFYDSPFNLTTQQNLDQADLKRPAEEVTQAARRWLQDNSDHPFFLFLHLYDLHKPYSLAPEVRARFRDREYDGALSYVDATLGDFWRFLKAKGLVDKSLIIFLSDHGESLGEHGERTHGYFIYESTVRVPLIIHWPHGSNQFPSRVEIPTGLIDVAPTILQFLGFPEPPQFQGRSLLELLDGKAQPAPREVYSESLYAHYHYGCAALRTLRMGDYKYISAPEPELYDLATDAAEQVNLYARMHSVDLAYLERLQKLRSRFASAGSRAQSSGVSPDVARALSSLGYVASSGSHAAEADSGPDPKARVDDYLKTEEAVTLSFAGQLPQSVELLKGVLSKHPELLDTRNLLALFEQKLGRREEAAEDFRKVLERDPTNLMAHYNLGVQYFQIHRLDDAARELEATLTIGSPRGASVEQITQPSEEMLGKIWLEKRDVVRARNQYNHLLTVFPRDFAAHYNLGWIAAEEKSWEEATRQLRAALEIEPNNARAHNALGTVYLGKGDFAQAGVEFSKAIRLDPKFAQAHYDLGMTLSKMHKRDEAAREFKKALEVDPKLLAAQRALDEMR